MHLQHHTRPAGLAPHWLACASWQHALLGWSAEAAELGILVAVQSLYGRTGDQELHIMLNHGVCCCPSNGCTVR